jgi:O-antigen/teichoic acid export membrane protein
MAGYVKLKLVNSVLSIALTLGANLLLIPLWGVLGAAVARLIGLATIEFLRVVEVWFLFRLLPYNLSFVKPVVAGLAALVVALAINPWFPAEANLLYLAIQVFTVFAMYAGTLLALGLAPEDRAVLIRMYQRASSMFSQNRAVLVSFLSARSG